MASNFGCLKVIIKVSLPMKMLAGLTDIEADNFISLFSNFDEKLAQFDQNGSNLLLQKLAQFLMSF